MTDTDFTWHDAERIVRFGEGAIADAPELLGTGYLLLTTPRAAAMAPQVAEGAGRLREIGPGLVDVLSAALLAEEDGLRDAPGGLLVALGGGRVIDVAKAVAAAVGTPLRVAAIPTTLSAAEMTGVHRHAAGVDPSTPRVRPAIVINDPVLSASQPADALAASAANSLAHAVEGPLTIRASPVPAMAAERAVALTAAAYGPASGDGANPDRTALALAALLSGATIDSTGYGLHHVLSQTLVREAGLAHGKANAAILPHSLGALRERSPAALARLETAARAGAGQGEHETDGQALERLAHRLASLAGASRLSELGVDPAELPRLAELASGRAELDLIPPRADAGELRSLLERAA